jgi:hypothetical protein
MENSSKAPASSSKGKPNTEYEEIKRIGKKVKDLKEEIKKESIKEISKIVWRWIAIISFVLSTILGITIYQIYLKATAELKSLLVDRIGEEFKQPMIRKTIEDVAANNAKQIFIAEIQPEVTKFKTDIQGEMTKFEKNIIERVDKISNEMQNGLTKQFPQGYTVLGFSSGHGVVIPKAFVPDGFKIDWSSTKIEEVTKDRISIRLPDITSKTFNFKKSAATIPKKVGSKAVFVEGNGWVLSAEILALEKDLIVIAVGFEPKK